MKKRYQIPALFLATLISGCTTLKCNLHDCYPETLSLEKVELKVGETRVAIEDLRYAVGGYFKGLIARDAGVVRIHRQKSNPIITTITGIRAGEAQLLYINQVSEPSVRLLISEFEDGSDMTFGEFAEMNGFAHFTVIVTE